VNSEDISRWQDLALHYGSELGIKVLAAIAFWIIGRWLIGAVGRLVQSALERQRVDATLMRYLGTVINVTLNIVLVIGILGYFGIQTTSFAALFAAAGVAIGLAWSGLLANFAGGVFLIILRPIKVGDFVTVGGITGTVKEVGLFTSALNTPDNVLTLIGNSKIFSDTIQNFSSNAYRRVDLKAQLAGRRRSCGGDEPAQGERIATLPNVLSSPPVDVEILEFNLVGPVLAVRPYCHTDHYWQVYFDTNRIIRETLSSDAFPAPMPAQVVFVNQQ
jgi:small conductance mechanosensitive channel